MLVSKIVVGQTIEINFRAAVRLVIDALPALFFDGAALIVEIRLGDVQRAHAIGFEVQREIELVLGQLLEINRTVLAGCAVHIAAIVQYGDEMLAFSYVGGALKHHVLEQVREPGVPRHLIAASHVVSDVYRIHRGAMIGDQNHPQAVIEASLVQCQLGHGDIAVSPCRSRAEPNGKQRHKHYLPSSFGRHRLPPLLARSRVHSASLGCSLTIPRMPWAGYPMFAAQQSAANCGQSSRAACIFENCPRELSSNRRDEV